MNQPVIADPSSWPITFMASILIWFMFAGLLVLWLVNGKISKEVVLHALISSLFAWTFAQMIKSLIPSLRPFEVNGRPPLTMTVPDGGAFPSGHTAAAFGIAVSIFLHDKKLGVAYILLALFVGVGRVLSNVHYPIDILIGALVGTLVAFAGEKVHVYKLLTSVKRRG